MVELKRIAEVKLTDLDYYRTKNIPAIGCYLKEEDRQVKQGELGLEVSDKES